MVPGHLRYGEDGDVIGDDAEARLPAEIEVLNFDQDKVTLCDLT